MTARVSCSSPSGPHMCPEVRIIAGIDASTITSLGTCRLVIPRLESTIASSGPSAKPCSIAALISAPWSRRVETGQDAAQTVVRAQPGLGQHPAVAVEHLRQERPDHMTEDDRVGDLHHRRLQMHREQHALGLGPGDLGGEELIQARPHATRWRRPPPRPAPAPTRAAPCGAVVGDQLDPQRAVRAITVGGLAGPEIVGGHMRHVGLRIAPTRPPSNADGCGRTASPTPGPDDQSCPPAAPGSPRCP